MKVTYFPGCTLRTKAKDLDLYTRRSAEALGVELCEPEDWQCCGGVFVSASDEIATKLSSVRALIAAKEENLFTRLSARVGVAINTMLDESGSHIAEMMIEGSNMGITELTKLLNDQRMHGDAKEAARLAEDVVHFEERNLEMLKQYL